LETVLLLSVVGVAENEEIDQIEGIFLRLVSQAEGEVSV
jgi:hypothetical protein